MDALSALLFAVAQQDATICHIMRKLDAPDNDWHRDRSRGCLVWKRQHGSSDNFDKLKIELTRDPWHATITCRIGRARFAATLDSDDIRELHDQPGQLTDFFMRPPTDVYMFCRRGLLELKFHSADGNTIRVLLDRVEVAAPPAYDA